MKHAYTIAIAAALLVSACTAAQLQTAQTDIGAGIQAACTDVMAAEKLNPNSASAPWATASCATATATAALVQNSATLQWLGSLEAQIVAPAPAAS